MADSLTQQNLDHLRANLTSKLDELHRRATHARELIEPFEQLKHLRLLADKRVQAGIGAVAALAFLAHTTGESLPRTTLRVVLAAAGAIAAFRALTIKLPASPRSRQQGTIVGELDAIPIPYAESKPVASAAYVSLEVDDPSTR